jgi:hypothetical protein
MSGSILNRKIPVTTLAWMLFGHREKTGSQMRKPTNQIRTLLTAHEPVHHLGFFTMQNASPAILRWFQVYQYAIKRIEVYSREELGRFRHPPVEREPRSELDNCVASPPENQCSHCVNVIMLRGITRSAAPGPDQSGWHAGPGSILPGSLLRSVRSC